MTFTQRKALQKCFLFINCLNSQFFSKDLSKILHLFQNLCSFISIIYHQLILISIEMPQRTLLVLAAISGIKEFFPYHYMKGLYSGD